MKLARSDARFPPRLKAIFDPPRSLYLRGSGEPELLGRRAVGVVGARSCSPYGAQVARMLGRELAAAGLVVVSGLARGIDGEAHRGALESGGPTVGVLGCGIDRDYPAANASLSRRMEDGGLVVSEYEAGVEPAPWRFPARNRIIAGLCEAVVVVEARERSGALITADFALEEEGGLRRAGRDHERALGRVECASAARGHSADGIRRRPRGPRDRARGRCGGSGRLRGGQASAGVGSGRAVGADELVARASLEAGAVSVALTELELAGLVAAADGLYRAVR